MADYKINHMTGRLYKFFTNSPSSYYDYLINRIQDIHEDVAFNDEKNVFFARVISDTSGIPPIASTEESQGSIEKLKHVLGFGRDNPSQYYNYAIKFRFAGEDEARNQVPDPSTANSKSEKDTLISLHSYAIVDKNNGILMGQPLTENDLITIRESDGIYYVTGKLNGQFAPPTAEQLRSAASAYANGTRGVPLGDINSSPQTLEEAYTKEKVGKNLKMDITTDVSDRVKWGETEEQIAANQAAWNYLRPFLPPKVFLTSVYRSQADQDSLKIRMARERGFVTSDPQQAFSFLKRNNVVIANHVGQGHGGKNGTSAFDISGYPVPSKADGGLMKEYLDLFMNDSRMQKYLKIQPFEKRPNPSLLEPFNGKQGIIHLGFYIKNVKVPYDPGFLRFFDPEQEGNIERFETEYHPDGLSWQDWKNWYPKNHEISGKEWRNLKRILVETHNVER